METNKVGAVRLVLMAIGIVGCVVFALMMPWAELDMDTSNEAIPHTLKLLKLDQPAKGVFANFEPQKPKLNEELTAKKAEGKHGDYVYAWALGLALLSGAVAIIAAGRDEEEKTLLPQK